MKLAYCSVVGLRYERGAPVAPPVRPGLLEWLATLADGRYIARLLTPNGRTVEATLELKSGLHAIVDVQRVDGWEG